MRPDSNGSGRFKDAVFTPPCHGRRRHRARKLNVTAAAIMIRVMAAAP